MKIRDRGIAARGPEGRPSAAFPGVCVSGSRWLVGFRAGPTKAAVAGQQAMLSGSDDEGKTWSEPVAPFEPPEVDGRPGVFRALYPTAVGGDEVVASLCWVDASDPSRPYFNEETQGLLATRIFHARSADAGRSWDEPRRMDTNPITMETPLTGPMLVLPDSSWGCQFELNKAYEEPAVWRHSSIRFWSAVGGKKGVGFG